MQIDRKKLKRNLKRLALTFLYVIELKIAYKSTGLLFKDELKDYNQVINDYVDMLEENQVTNPVDVFTCFSQTLWNGYLSENQNYEYDIKRKIYFDNFGLGCINGEGVCLNNADMLTDIFRSYGYEASTVITYVHADSQPIARYLNEYKIISDDTIIFNIIKQADKILTYLIGNHAITVVKYNDELYCFDPTNLCYLFKIKENQVQKINGELTMDIKYMVSLLFTDLDMDTFTDNNAEYIEKMINPIYLDKEVLQEFYDQEQELYKRIKDGCENKIPVLHLIFATFILYQIRTYIIHITKNGLKYKMLKDYCKEINEDIHKDNQEMIKKLNKCSQ